MEAQAEKDPCASVIESSRPTTSQEAKFPNCLFVRGSADFVDSSQGQFSSSPDMTPSEATIIFIMSPPGSSESSDSVNQNMVEEDSVSLTPPEHDQNVNECCTEGLTIAEAMKVGVLEAGLDEEPEAKRARMVTGEDFKGEAVPLGEKEEVELEVVRDTDFISDNEDSGGEERTTSCLAGIVGVGREIGGLMKDGVVKFDTIDGNHELRKCESVEDIQVTRGENPNENSDLCGDLESGKTEGLVLRLKHTVGERHNEVELKNGADGSEKVIEVSKDPNIPKGSHRDGGVKSMDELGAKRVIEVPSEAFDGETVPLCETEVVGIEGDEGVQDSDVDSDSRNSGGWERTTSYLAEGSSDVTEFDARNENHELRENCDFVEDIRVTGGNNSDGNSYPSGSLDIDKIKGEIVRILHKVSEKCSKKDNSGSEEVDEIMEDEEIPKDIHIDGGVCNGKRTEEMEEFGHTGDANPRCERTGRHPLLPSKEKEVVGNLERKRGLLELLNELESVLGETEECEELDIIETAQKCGWSFPRVRWWPADGEDWSDGLP